MDKDTFEALKFIMHHSEHGGANDKEFWDNFKLVESWIKSRKYCPDCKKLYSEDEIDPCDIPF